MTSRLGHSISRMSQSAVAATYERDELLGTISNDVVRRSAEASVAKARIQTPPDVANRPVHGPVRYRWLRLGTRRGRFKDDSRGRSRGNGQRWVFRNCRSKRCRLACHLLGLLAAQPRRSVLRSNHEA
jgi:hypothetical protein